MPPQIQTAVNRTWEMAAGDAELQQHLLSQINNVEGKLTAIQASNATGTAHPTATLWLGREPLGWMGSPSPSARRLNSQCQQQQASQVKQRLHLSTMSDSPGKRLDQGSRPRLQVHKVSRKTAQQRLTQSHLLHHQLQQASLANFPEQSNSLDAGGATRAHTRRSRRCRTRSKRLC